jgi:hypothetical protein
MTNTIRVLTASTAKGMFDDAPVLTEISIEQLKNNLTRLNQDIGELFSNIKMVGDFNLKEVEVGIEISAQGGVNLIGTLTAGAKTAITLTFERP